MLEKIDLNRQRQLVLIKKLESQAYQRESLKQRINLSRSKISHLKSIQKNNEEAVVDKTLARIEQKHKESLEFCK